MMPRDILLYSEHPASTGSLIFSLRSAFPAADYNLRQIYQADIRGGILRQPDSRLLILPGIIGEDSHYTTQLDKAALDDIHDFVSTKNNVLLTICAGTYFSCRETLYDPPWGNRKTQYSLRPLFNALAHGPVQPHGVKATPESHFSDVSVVPIRFKTPDGRWLKTGICYGNGPGIYPDTPGHPDTETLAVYDDVDGHPAALIRQRVGEGAVYLSSILPEIGWQDIRPHPGLEHITALMNDLKQHEAGQQALWRSLTNRIKQDLG